MSLPSLLLRLPPMLGFQPLLARLPSCCLPEEERYSDVGPLLSMARHELEVSHLSLAHVANACSLFRQPHPLRHQATCHHPALLQLLAFLSISQERGQPQKKRQPPVLLFYPPPPLLDLLPAC